MTVTVDGDAGQLLVRVLVLAAPLLIVTAHAVTHRGSQGTLLLSGLTALAALAANLLPLADEDALGDFLRTFATGMFAVMLLQLLALDAERTGGRALVDQALQRTPQSTRSLRCPWWLAIMLELTGAATLGVLAGTTVGLTVAVLAVLLAAQQAATRRRGPAAC